MSDGDALTSQWLETFRRLELESADDPTANPVMRLGMEICDGLAGGQIGLDEIEAAIQYLTVENFAERADRLRRYLGTVDPRANDERLDRLFRALACQPFATFKAMVESEMFGLVFTAHPTFEIGAGLMRILNRLATEPLPQSERQALLAEAAARPHRPDENLSLEYEHGLSLEAIGNLRLAVHRALDVLLRVAAEAYPDEWRGLTPTLLTVASWVGYDLDGRSDISFADILARRLAVQARQAECLKKEFGELPPAAGNGLGPICNRLGEAISGYADELAVFARFDAEDRDDQAAIQALGKRLSASGTLRPTTADDLLPMIDALVAGCSDNAVARRIMVLRADMAANGVALARTHVRINSTQLHNAIRKDVRLETAPDDPRFRQSYTAAIGDLIAATKPVTINFGTLMAERSSAKRLFMTVAQMLKYMDGRTPVRFLIAECESSFTVLVALYYAKLFGIEDHIEICPLFETEKALHLGSRIIEQLLANTHFVAYMRAQGRLCIQTGYSDAGRFIGQTPASGSIERLKERVVRLFERPELDGVQLVFFDTHGESVGRGGHPGGIRDRLDYIHPPLVAEMIAAHGIAYKQESSFQGGDGFVPFMNEAGAYAMLTGILEWRLSPRAHDPDLFYRERDYVTEFLTTIKEMQTALIADPDYALLVGIWGGNLLYKTGSRASRREDSSERFARPQISQFRAIPHNAVLQQLGLMVNTVTGAGTAIHRDPAHFARMYGHSSRFGAIMGMIVYAASASHADVLKAYVDTFDPGFWLLRAISTRDPTNDGPMRDVADALEELDVHHALARVFRKLLKDAARLRREIALIDLSAMPSVTTSTQSNVCLLNAMRLALIHRIYALAAGIPAFSTGADDANRRVMTQILRLDIPGALATLRLAFPAHAAAEAVADYGEVATYHSDGGQNYRHEHEAIFAPMERMYDLVRRISTAIAHGAGAIG